MIDGVKRSMVPVISVVGRTNSGKTTLIEQILPELKRRGYRVGTIKHDVHQFDIDHEGKDTWRMTRAGADNVVIASGGKIAMIKNINREYHIDELSAWLFTDVDIIITEGFKKQNKPKIEVTRTGELLCTKDSNPIGFVDNTVPGVRFCPPEGIDAPCLKMDETLAIVDLIEKNIRETVKQ